MGKQDHQQAASVDPLVVGAADIGGDAIDDVVEDGLVEVVNTSGQVQRFTIDGRTITLPPKKTTRVPKAYGVVRVGANPNGDKLAPVVCLLTGNKVQPSDPAHRVGADGRPLAKAG